MRGAITHSSGSGSGMSVSRSAFATNSTDRTVSNLVTALDVESWQDAEFWQTNSHMRPSAERSGSDEAGLVGEHDDLHPVAQPELGQDPANVRLHRGLGHA